MFNVWISAIADNDKAKFY